jgi:hypothetical protein
MRRLFCVKEKMEVGFCGRFFFVSFLLENQKKEKGAFVIVNSLIGLDEIIEFGLLY